MSHRTKESIKDLSDLPNLLKSATIKKEEEMTLTATPTATPVRNTMQFSTCFADPMAPIAPEEGLDVCLWKLMSDRKARKLEDIGEKLNHYGFNREIVKDRVVKLCNRNWFERSSKGKNTTYKLRKGVAMPIAKEDDVGSSLIKSAPGVQLQPVRKNVAIMLPTTFPRDTRQDAASNTDVTVNCTHLDVTSTATADPTLHKEDGLRRCIWNVMSDYKQYTASDVGLLLKEVGFHEKSAAVAMSTLAKEGWFDRIKVGAAYVYTLLPHIAVPALIKAQLSVLPAGNKTPSIEKEIPVKNSQQFEALMSLSESSKSDPKGDFGSETKEDQKTEQQIHPSGAFLPDSKENPGMNCQTFGRLGSNAQAYNKLASNGTVQFSVNFEGMLFTFPEIQDLLKDLVATGFGPDYEPTEVMKSKLLSIDIMVRGTSVKPEALQSLTMYLLSLGFKGE